MEKRKTNNNNECKLQQNKYESIINEIDENETDELSSLQMEEGKINNDNGYKVQQNKFESVINEIRSCGHIQNDMIQYKYETDIINILTKKYENKLLYQESNNEI